MTRTLLFSTAICLVWSGCAMAQEGRYVVLFPFDKSTVDATAQATITSAAEAFKRSGAAQISLQGNTDTSGNSDYNQALSERREHAVTNELVRLGVPASAISATAVGESNPAVQTGDNVREQQNRRVDIQIVTPQPAPVAAVAPAPAPAPAPVAEMAPPPPDGSPWSFSPGIFFGYIFHDDEGDQSQFAGINLSLDYRVTDWASVGVEQAVFYNFDTPHDGIGGRTVMGPDFFLGDVFYVGANVGYLYGSGIDDGFVGGPEVGVQWNMFDMKVAYDIPFSHNLDDGNINTTVGAVFKF
jgi:hypothetical protein